MDSIPPADFGNSKPTAYPGMIASDSPYAALMGGGNSSGIEM